MHKILPGRVRKVSLIIAAVALAGLGSAFAQEMVYPQDADWWTGSCYQYGRQQNGEIEWRDPNIGRLSGWTKFDLSPITDTVTVTGVRLHYRVEVASGSPAVSIRRIWLDPVLDDGEGTYSAIETGQELGIGMGAPGWQSLSLNADGVRHVQSCLEQGWVALGFWSKSLSTNWARAYGHSGSDRPYLVVNYTTAGVAEPGTTELPFGIAVWPSVVSNGRAELRYSGIAGAVARAVVYDATGRELLTENLSVGQSGGAVSLDLRELDPGVYFARLETGDRTVTGKFLVQ